MIREQYPIDTFLIQFFMNQRKLSLTDSTQIALLEWYSSLESKNLVKTRECSINLVKSMAKDALGVVVNYPEKSCSALLNMFEPLELILRIALSLNDPIYKLEEPHTKHTKPEKVRDHLSHTIRNVLFSIYLLDRLGSNIEENLKKQLIIAALFHDIAYPIQKLKKVAKKLGYSTLTTLLNSKGDIEIELSSPDDLLDILDYMGNIPKNIDKKIKELEEKGELIKNEKESIDSEINEYKKLREKFVFIYKNIISRSIAGCGLFDTPHYLSSVVLFIRPLVKYWRNLNVELPEKMEVVADICITMAYHDRDMGTVKDFDKFLMIKCLRLADELQEWDREMLPKSLVRFVEIKEGTRDRDNKIHLRIALKDSDTMKCEPDYFISDKIKGISSILDEDEVIKIDFELPRKFESQEKIDEFIGKLQNKLKGIGIERKQTELGSHVSVKFEQSKVELRIN